MRTVLALLCSVVLILSSGDALAKKKKKASSSNDSSGQVIGKTHSGKKIVRRENTVDADSSEANRQDKKGSVVAEVGFGVGGIPTSGFAAGYYLDPDSMVEFSYVSGGYDILFINIDASLASVKWKRWWGNSFYTNLGGGLRTIGFDATLEPFTGNDDVSSSLEVTSFGLDFAIGNRWQWENFTMGCDWIGYFVPLSSSGDTEVNDPEADKDDREELENTADSLGKTSSGQLLRFYLGASF